MVNHQCSVAGEMMGHDESGISTQRRRDTEKEKRKEKTGGDMNREFSEEDYPLQALTDEIIAAAVAVHRELGPGFLEKIYENALVIELESRNHKVDRQVGVEVCYRGEPIGRHRIDLLVDDAVVIELKSVEALGAHPQSAVAKCLKGCGKTRWAADEFQSGRPDKGRETGDKLMATRNNGVHGKSRFFYFSVSLRLCVACRFRPIKPAYLTEAGRSRVMAH